MSAEQFWIWGIGVVDDDTDRAGIKDTHPAARRVIVEGYRRMSPAEKIRCVDEMTKTVQQMALARIRRQYPNSSKREQQLRLASLWLDRETMIKAFEWDPEMEDH